MSEHRKIARSIARATGADPVRATRTESGPYGTTGRPKGEGAHMSGRDILLRKRFGILPGGETVIARIPVRPAPEAPRPSLFKRAAQSIRALFRKGATRAA